MAEGLTDWSAGSMLSEPAAYEVIRLNRVLSGMLRVQFIVDDGGEVLESVFGSLEEITELGRTALTQWQAEEEMASLADGITVALPTVQEIMARRDTLMQYV